MSEEAHVVVRRHSTPEDTGYKSRLDGKREIAIQICVSVYLYLKYTRGIYLELKFNHTDDVLSGNPCHRRWGEELRPILYGMYPVLSKSSQHD